MTGAHVFHGEVQSVAAVHVREVGGVNQVGKLAIAVLYLGLYSLVFRDADFAQSA